MYILECADGTYYTGSTWHLEKRMQEHNEGLGARYTANRRPVKLLYIEEYERIDDAYKREKQVQGWSRKKKQALINGSSNRLPELSKNYTEHPSRVSTLRQAQYRQAQPAPQCAKVFKSLWILKTLIDYCFCTLPHYADLYFR